MTTEEVAAIREKWAEGVLMGDLMTGNPPGVEFLYSEECVIAHENELRQTIRDLCDEIVRLQGAVERVMESSVVALEKTLKTSEASKKEHFKLGLDAGRRGW